MASLLVLAACCSLSLGQASPVTLTPDALAHARTLADQGHLSEAETEMRRYLVAHDSEAQAHYLLAYILFRQGQPLPSLAESTLAARTQAPNAQQLSYVAFDYVLAKDYPDADKWMTQVTERVPRDSTAWYSLGRIKYSEFRFQEAVACFQKALALAPHLVKAENNLGLAYEALNQGDAAVEAYRTAIAWQAGSANPSEQPLINLGIVLLDKNEFGEAQPLLQQAERIAPADSRLHAALGRLFQKKGDLAEAQAEMELAVKFAPTTAAYHFLLGQAYRRSGLAAQAKNEFAKASALDAADRAK